MSWFSVQKRYILYNKITTNVNYDMLSMYIVKKNKKKYFLINNN